MTWLSIREVVDSEWLSHGVWQMFIDLFLIPKVISWQRWKVQFQSSLKMTSQAFVTVFTRWISQGLNRLMVGWGWGSLCWNAFLTKNIVGATVLFLLIFSVNFHTSVFLAFLFGCSQSAFWSLTAPLAVEMLGTEQLPTAFGVLTFSRGVACFLGPPIGGYIVDITGIS